MLTGELRSKVDALWNAFWYGGIANSIEVIEQITYLRDSHPESFRDAKLREHFHHGMFRGYDFDNTMLRIGSINMALDGVDNPDIRYKDSLDMEHAGDEEAYSLILVNPPFAGSLDYENTANGTNATPAQLEFIDVIVSELTASGVVEAKRLYESPYLDISPQGPDALFPSAQVDRMFQILEEFKKRAAA